MLNMEVHHHPNVEKKGFREYFLEFIMIFLAVTLGFFAETFRETVAAHRLVREYAVSEIKDLQMDTAHLRQYRDYYRYAAGNVDTLLQLLSAAEPGKVPTGKLYWYGLFGGAHGNFTPDDATLQQIKSTGSLRYFNNEVAGAIAVYDLLCRNMANEQDVDGSLYGEVRRCRARIFEFRYNEKANDVFQANRSGVSRTQIDSFINSHPPLLTDDKSLFNQYAEMVRSRFLRVHAQHLDTLLATGTRLITLMQKNYRLSE